MAATVLSTDQQNERLKQEIEEEERMISLLERQLKDLERKEAADALVAAEQQQQVHQAVTTTSSEGDPFDFLFPDHQDMTTRKLLESIEILEEEQEEQSEWQALQPVLRQFCYTNVIRCRKNASDSTTASSASYMLEGYFTAQPDVQAKFHVTFRLPQKQGGNQQKESAPSIDTETMARILDLSCELSWKQQQNMNVHVAESSTVTVAEGGSDADQVHTLPRISLTWLAGETQPRNDPYHLAAWITGLHQFLAFDRKRRTYLEEHKNTIRVVEIRNAQYRLSLTTTTMAKSKTTTSGGDAKNDDDARLGGQQQHQKTYSLIWGYKFRESRDVLRLTQETFEAGGLSQSDLDALVEVCQNSCQSALTVMERHLLYHDRRRRRRQRKKKKRQRTYRRYVFDDADLSRDSMNSSSSSSNSSGSNSDDDNEDSSSMASNSSSSMDESDRRYAWSPSTGRRRSAYEIQRLRKIERNQEKLQSLGLAAKFPTTSQDARRRIRPRNRRTPRNSLMDYRGTLVDDPAATAAAAKSKKRRSF